VAAAVLVESGELRPFMKRAEILCGDESEWQEMQHRPDRLGPELKPADEGDAVRHQRDDHERANDVTGKQRNAEAHFQGKRHDRRLDGKEQECEGRVDQRRNGRADIAEPGAAGEEIDIDAVLGRVVGDRQSGEKDD
jgi:hypothetical protein